MTLPLSAPITPNVLPQQPAPISLEEMYKDLQEGQQAGADEESLAGHHERIQQRIREMKQADLETISPAWRATAGLVHGAENAGRNLGDILTSVDNRGAESKFFPPSSWEKFKEDSEPYHTPAGELGTGVGEALALAPLTGPLEAGLGAAGTAKVLPKFLTGAAGRSAVQGAVQGSVAAGPGNRGKGALAGGLGAALGTTVLGGARRAFLGQEASPAAKLLESQGVTLTPGQRNPRGWLNNGEEVAQRVWGIGAGIREARTAALPGFQQAVLRSVHSQRAPPLDPSRPIGERFKSVIEGLRADYHTAMDGETIYPARFTPGKPPQHLQSTAPGKPVVGAVGVLDEALHDGSQKLSDAERKDLSDFVHEQFYQEGLPRHAPPPGTGIPPVKASQLQGVRSRVRELQRDYTLGTPKQTDTASGRLLGNVNDEMTDVFDTQLPPHKRQILREADSNWREQQVVRRAINNRPQALDGFSPNDVLQAGKALSEDYPKAFGGGYRNRPLAEAANEVLAARSPANGSLVLGLPAALPAAVAASPTMRPFIMGSTPPQRAAQFLENALRKKMGARGDEAVRRALPVLSGAAAGERQRE